jgi:hypothetical protein
VYGCERGSKGCSEAQGNNGVIVGVAAQDKGAEGSTEMTKDGKVRVTFTGEVMDKSEFSGDIAHEGSHVIDSQNYIKSGTSVTDFEAEYRAFTVQSVMAHAVGYAYYTVGTLPTAKHPNGMAFVLYSEGWKEADKVVLATIRARRDENIKKNLAVPKEEGGIYELTPDNTRRSYYPPKP